MPTRIVELAPIEGPADSLEVGQQQQSSGSGKARSNSRSAGRRNRRFEPYVPNAAPPTLGLSGPLHAMELESASAPISARTRLKKRFGFQRTESEEVESLVQLIGSGPVSQRQQASARGVASSAAPSSAACFAVTGGSVEATYAAPSSHETASSCIASSQVVPAAPAPVAPIAGAGPRSRRPRRPRPANAETGSVSAPARLTQDTIFEYTLQADGTTHLEIIKPKLAKRGPVNAPGIVLPSEQRLLEARRQQSGMGVVPPTGPLATAVAGSSRRRSHVAATGAVGGASTAALSLEHMRRRSENASATSSASDRAGAPSSTRSCAEVSARSVPGQLSADPPICVAACGGSAALRSVVEASAIRRSPRGKLRGVPSAAPTRRARRFHS